ncbi:MAG TPA: MarR family transcriptional regulator [Jatrophihabitans sp.]|nr:MarR family transcriptional regulator [Jatrophihabitans sp.]
MDEHRTRRGARTAESSNHTADKPFAEILAERQVAGLAVDLPAMAAVSNIHRVATQIRNHLEQGVLRDSGLTWTGFVALWVLWIWGETQTRWLAEEVGVSRSTLSGVVKTLERRDLVMRRVHEDEGRLVVVELTPAGAQLIEELFPRFNDEERFVVSALSDDAMRRLTNSLRSIQETLNTYGERRRA